MSLSRCRVVLVRTHYAGNLGASARVMYNFGLDDLVLVDPRADANDRQALQMSTHAESVLRSARITATLDEALRDCVLVFGASARAGGPFRRQSVRAPEEVLPRMAQTLAGGHRTALVFGPEPSGLTDEEVTRCHWLIRIPTEVEYSSLNLAQAVAICLYELHKAWRQLSGTPSAREPPASVADQERLFASLKEALEAVHFLYPPKGDALFHAVRHLLGRAELTDMEVKILHGLAQQLHTVVEQKSRDGQ